MVTATHRPSTPSAAPFDEKIEDQHNEAFYRQVAKNEPTTKKTGVEGGVEQRQSLQQINQESLKKYQEFERKWQQEKESPEKDNQERGLEQPPEQFPEQPLKKEEPEEGEESLSEDIYSLIYTANVCSQPFYFALVVFVMQFTLMLLILLDLADLSHDDGSNPLRIPPGVPIRVNVAQAISCLLIVATILADSGDLPNGIGNLAAGYDPIVLSKNPHASCLKWFTAFFLQSMTGISMTVVLFLLVMQSKDVVSLALNFAALSFIYEIDNITFALGKLGFLTHKIRIACEKVPEHCVPKKGFLRQQVLRKILTGILTIGLFIPYGLLVHNQWDSQYLCSRLYIQFNGEGIPDLVYYTGNFEVHKRDQEIFGSIRSRIDDRVYYKDKNTQKLILAYCNREEAWTISLNTTDHCAYLYKSQPTTTFDVTDLAGMTWYVWDFHSRRTFPVDLYLRCDDCDDGPRGNCHSLNGFCNDSNECVCHENRLGLHCEHDLPVCESFRRDARTSELPVEQGVWFSDHYQLLYAHGTNEIVQAQNRPVYIAYYYDTAENGTGTDDAVVGTDFMFFNGRRWVILGRDTKGLGEVNRRQRSRRAASNDDDIAGMKKALVELFGTEEGFALEVLPLVFPLEGILKGTMGENYTKATLPHYRPFFYSEAVDPLSEADTSTPHGLSWYPAERPSHSILSQWRPDESRSILSSFLCSACDKVSNPCLNAGVCNSDSKCECTDVFTGSMCERTVSCRETGYCLNNGTCAEWKDSCTCSDGYFGSLCQYERVSPMKYVVEV